MKKIILTIIGLVFITSSLTTAFAVEGPPGSEATKSTPTNITPDTNPLKDAKFNVNKILTLDNETPDYFEDANRSPILSFIIRVINFFTRIIGSISIIIMIIGGFMFMFAQGNQQKVDEAKEIIKYAVIGLIVTFMSYIIVIFIQSLFITSELPPPQS